MDQFKETWEMMKGDLVPWVILMLVFSLINSFTGGFGFLLVPNLFRTIRNALREERAPEMGELFQFDDISDDLVTMILQSVANFVGFMLCFVGAIVTSVLFFWAPMLAADGDFAPMDAMKASMAHGKENFGEIIMFMIMAAVINTVGFMVCCVGILVTAPLTVVAAWRFYESHRDAILAAADAQGLPRKA
ncbi:MAG: hypothetical protein KC502_05625 [Myxococcales bacterium]|nr:hypothetical protein [Myxococcales bacterium]